MSWIQGNKKEPKKKDILIREMRRRRGEAIYVVCIYMFIDIFILYIVQYIQ